MKMNWAGVIPAITTPFRPDYNIDHDFLARHCEWLIENGCTGIVALGSLGEGQTLRFGEKRELLSTCVKALRGRAPVIAGVSALSTSEAVEIGRMASDEGCSGLMILPPYVYVGDWREMKAHVSAVLEATELSSMLYNNPVAYKVDFTPVQVKELLAEHQNLHAIKESSADVRRLAALREITGEDRLRLLVGVDDLIVESVPMGAVGWIAGLVNAFPRESVKLFELAQSGNREKTHELYRWFLPLLRMDTVPKFVQLIKFVQQQVGMGNARVRPPRLPLSSDEQNEVLAVLERALAARPKFETATVVG